MQLKITLFRKMAVVISPLRPKTLLKVFDYGFQDWA